MKRILIHSRTKGSKNGERRYQYEDGTWTPLGLERRRAAYVSTKDDFKRAKIYEKVNRNRPSHRQTRFSDSVDSLRKISEELAEKQKRADEAYDEAYGVVKKAADKFYAEKKKEGWTKEDFMARQAEEYGDVGAIQDAHEWMPKVDKKAYKEFIRKMDEYKALSIGVDESAKKAAKDFCGEYANKKIGAIGGRKTYQEFVTSDLIWNILDREWGR